MIQCDVCKKTVFDADKSIVDWGTLKKITDRGFVPSYYLERDKEGIEYGLPKERKWKNIVKSYPKDNIEICRDCYGEMKEVINSKSSKAFYCFIATAAYGSPYANEVKVLRNYRDKVLMKNAKGRLLMKIYYFFSPLLSKFIAKSRPLQKITQKVINHQIRKLSD